MVVGDRPGEVDLVLSRLDFLEALAERPLAKPALVERLDHSRSTVDRAVRDLEAADLVVRTTEGWVPTQAGRLAARRCRAFLSEAGDVMAARDVLGAVPPEYEVPPSLVTGACIETGERARQFLEGTGDALRSADRLRAIVPSVSDSRQVRLCHSLVVRNGVDVSVLVEGDSLDRLAGEFPRLLADLDDAEPFSAWTGSVPEFGLFLVDDAESGGCVTLVAYDDGAPSGFVHTDDPAAVEWAADVFETEREGATADPAVTPDSRTPDLASVTGGRLPLALRSEGFVRVDESYLDRQEPLSPAAAWRAGLGLAEAMDGYAVSREFDDGESVAARVRERLEAGSDVALLGPAGSGKSTVCKRVAAECFGAGWTVFYRETGAGQPFESAAELERTVEGTAGRTLVVVEDAVRPEGSAVFEVARALSGRDDVVFLVDSRAAEWHDTTGPVRDARAAAFRRDAVETVSMPPLSASDCARFVDRAEAITGTDLPVSGESLYESIADARADGRVHSRTATLAFDRLARYVDPLRPEDDVPSSFDEDVDRVLSGLDERGETALDVGVTVAVLNLAGLGVYPGYVFAAAGGSGGADDGTVAETLDWLEGRVLYPDEGTGPPYRTVHETWSARFLERVRERTGTVAGQRRLGRCLTGLLALADDPGRGDVPAARASGRPAVPEAPVASPGEWADAAAESVFRTGVAYPKLAPLFGTTADSAVALPEACSAGAAVACARARGWAYLRAGLLDRAAAEFEAVETVAASADAGHGAATDRLRGLAEVARRRGDTEAAAAYAADLLERAESAGDDRAAALGRLTYGRACRQRGDLDRADELFERALETFAEREDAIGAARALNERGLVALSRPDYETATDCFERSLARYRETADSRGWVDARGNLGRVAQQTGEFERASDHYLQALETAREVGDRDREAKYLERLGNLADHRNEYDDALAYFDRAESVAREFRLAARLPGLLRRRADVHTKRCEYDRAESLYERALGRAEETGDTASEARTLRGLALLKNWQNDLDAAREYAETALDRAREVGDRRVENECLQFLGYAGLMAGDLDRAERALEAALSIARDIDDARKEREALNLLGMCHRRRGELDSATACAREHLALADATEHSTGGGHSILGAVAIDRGEYETAVDHLERARDEFEAIDHSRGVASTSVDLARAHRHLGALDRARDHLDAVASVLDDEDHRAYAVRADIERGAIARERGRLDEARDRLRHALAETRSMANAIVAARAALQLGRLERERDALESARLHVRAAVERYDGMGAGHLLGAAARDLAAIHDRRGDESTADRYARLAERATARDGEPAPDADEREPPDDPSDSDSASSQVP